MADYLFKIQGMHCPACEHLVRDVLADEGLTAEPSLEKATVKVEGLTLPPQEWKAVGNRLLDRYGYRLFLQDEDPRKAGRRATLMGLALGAVLLGVFAALQFSGILTLFSPEKLELGSSFVLGLLASVSSCFALVGGLLVSFAAEVGKTRPQALAPGLTGFHLARLGVFFVLGGVLGQAGQALALHPSVMNGLLTAAALVMTLLGLNLLGALRFTLPGWKVRPPQGRSPQGRSVWQITVTGILLGASTFFLPCGFTQSVQFQALASGSFLDGALVCLAFALGTLPVLFLVGWSLTKGLGGRQRAVLLKASGVLVTGLGLFQLWGAANLWGLARLWA